MGYTHYFTFKPAPKGKVRQTEALYQKAIIECSTVAFKYNKELKSQGRDSERLSGYTAHCKPGYYGGVNLNGKGELSHETFILREHYKQNNAKGLDGFNFCKTARKPYDIVVVACLSILADNLGKLVQVSSDGKGENWIDGIKLAERILGRPIGNPIDATLDTKLGRVLLTRKG